VYFGPKCISLHVIQRDVPPSPLRCRASSTSIISPPYSVSHVPFLMSLTANTPSPPCGTKEGRTSRGGSCSIPRFAPMLRCVLTQASDAGKSERAKCAYPVSTLQCGHLSVDHRLKCRLRFLCVEIYVHVVKRVCRAPGCMLHAHLHQCTCYACSLRYRRWVVCPFAHAKNCTSCICARMLYS